MDPADGVISFMKPGWTLLGIVKRGMRGRSGASKILKSGNLLGRGGGRIRRRWPGGCLVLSVLGVWE